MEITGNNPWAVENLDTYLYYCCPECDEKFKLLTTFINHAFLTHPDAKENLKLEDILKYEENAEDIVIKSDIDIKQEEDEVVNDAENNEVGNEGLDEFYTESLEWYESAAFETFEDPPKKKRGRPPKHKIEGNVPQMYNNFAINFCLIRFPFYR